LGSYSFDFEPLTSEIESERGVRERDVITVLTRAHRFPGSRMNHEWSGLGLWGIGLG
jgi:hypothetical protein